MDLCIHAYLMQEGYEIEQLRREMEEQTKKKKKKEKNVVRLGPGEDEWSMRVRW